MGCRSQDTDQDNKYWLFICNWILQAETLQPTVHFHLHLGMQQFDCLLFLPLQYANISSAGQASLRLSPLPNPFPSLPVPSHWVLPLSLGLHEKGNEEKEHGTENHELGKNRGKRGRKIRFIPALSHYTPYIAILDLGITLVISTWIGSFAAPASGQGLVSQLGTRSDEIHPSWNEKMENWKWKC